MDPLDALGTPGIGRGGCVRLRQPGAGRPRRAPRSILTRTARSGGARTHALLSSGLPGSLSLWGPPVLGGKLGRKGQRLELLTTSQLCLLCSNVWPCAELPPPAIAPRRERSCPCLTAQTTLWCRRGKCDSGNPLIHLYASWGPTAAC